MYIGVLCNICQKKACGDSSSVIKENSVKLKRDGLPGLTENYKLRDVFNVDKTDLFFRYLLDRTLTFKNKTCYSGKNTKESVISCLLAAKIRGIWKSEKIPLFSSS